MTTRAQREFLKVQLLETQQLREMAGDHPLMSVAFAEREAELREQLDALPPGQEEVRWTPFFGQSCWKLSYGGLAVHWVNLVLS